MEHTLTVLYFRGCPAAQRVADAAERAASRLGDGWNLELIDQERLNHGDWRRGYGSPTVLIDGHDLLGVGRPTSPGLCCRTYGENPPDADDIVAAARARVVE